MFKSFFAKSRNRKVGFTLIELLVVIAIIGVLASIVLASLNTARRKSRDARRISDVKQIQLALELYFDAQATVTYPLGAAACDATATFYGLQALLTGGFVPQVPKDPNQNAPNNCYRYATPTAAGTQSTYHLGTRLEDANNPVFGSDKDCTSAAVGCGAAAYAGGTGFDGTTDATNQIYDVIP